MDSLLGNSSSSVSNSPLINYTDYKYSGDALVIEKTLSNSNEDSVNIDFKDKLKSLSITAQEIVKKLNELLKGSLPEGVESLNTADYTADATSTRIVQGATAFFGVFKDQHPDLSDEDLLNKFMDTIKGGIQQGYDDAYGTLKGLGAFDLDGVQAGVEQTKILIDDKLTTFYQAKRKELGLDSGDVETQTKETASSEILKKAATSLNITA
jgi:hypothetical protein